MIEVSLIISLIAAACSVIGLIRFYRRDARQDATSEVQSAVETAVEFTRVNVKLDNLSQQFTDIIRSNEKLLEKITMLNTDLASVKSRISLLFEYKDSLEKRIEKLEGKENKNDSKSKHN